MWDLKDYKRAQTPAEAVAMLRQGPGKGMYIAGGTDLYLFPPKVDFVVDINDAGINNIARTPDDDVFLGAAATMHDIATNELVTDFGGGALSIAAARCGNRPVRTTATIGGNICNALPSADMAPVLLALDATCFIVDEDSQETLPLSDFFTGPRQTVLGDRLLVGMALPGAACQWHCKSQKVTRSAEDIALAQVAVALGVEDGKVAQVRIALGSVSPVPMRSTLAEDQLTGKALADIDEDLIRDVAEIAAGEAEPIDDHRAGAEYRKELVRVWTRRLVTDLLADAAE